MKSKPNKSTAPRPLRSTDLVRDLLDEAMLCRNETADDVAALLEEAASEIKRLQLLVSTIPSDAITMSALEALNGQHSSTERQTFVRNLVTRLQELSVALETFTSPSQLKPSAATSAVWSVFAASMFGAPFTHPQHRHFHFFSCEVQLHEGGGFHPALLPTGAWYFDTAEERDKIYTALVRQNDPDQRPGDANQKPL